MKTEGRFLFLGGALAMILALVLTLLVNPSPAIGQEKEYRKVEVVARQFSYMPEVITVKQGERIRVRFKSRDVEHGFYLEGYDINEAVRPGEVRVFEFVADRAGSFRFRCSVACGPFHPFMVGKLVVEPNSRIWWALGLTTLLPLATIALMAVRRSRER